MFYSAQTGGFYTGDQVRPGDAIEIADSDYEKLFAGQAIGKTITAGADGKPTLTDTRQTRTLEGLQAELRAQVDSAAERERLKYITPGAGQAMTYQEKFAEVVRYEADPNPLKENYPMMTAEIGVTGGSLTAVAQAIRAAYDQWKQIGTAIEVVRLTAKAGIDKATTEKAAQAAANVTWPTP